MKFWMLFCVAVLFLTCSSPNDCELSEQSTYSTAKFVTDKGYNKYPFKFNFSQQVEVYNGDCAAEKNVNETTLTLTSYAACDQVVNFTIDIDLGTDSYQIKKNNIAIKSNETLDFGIVRENSQRIDFAEMDIALFCPLCPGDTP